jgi:hypothetical protein
MLGEIGLADALSLLIEIKDEFNLLFVDRS